jgi:GNAT superfamily N-acetyltransferase
MAEWVIEPIGRGHDRLPFSCGKPALDTYIRKQAGQDARRSVSQTFVAVRPDSRRVWGYYTLSAGAVLLRDLPEQARRKLPSYPEVPVALLGRLAIDAEIQGTGLGRTLLIHALRNAAAASLHMGLYAVEVDAIDEDARQFYEKYGFASLLDDPRHLFLSMKVVRALFASP